MPGFDSPVFAQVATLNDVVAKLRAELSATPAGQSAGPSVSLPAGTNPASHTALASKPANGQSSGSQPQWAEQGGVVGPSGSPIPSSSGSSGADGFQQDLGSGPVAGGYVDSCCGPLIEQLETTANAFATTVPAFSSRFRNLNLILEGLSLVNSIVNQANTLKQSVRALRQAPNQQAAAAALTTVQSQLQGISSGGGFVQDVSMPLQH